jgi:hypothetical protein
MTTPQKARCFLSYAHEDAERNALEYFEYLLKQALAPEGHLIVDKDVKPGEDFGKFMELLDSVDAVILILTPAYKRKVSDRKGGVYDEFSRLLVRYEESNLEIAPLESIISAENQIKRFQILPVLFSGSRDDSVPTRIRSLRCLDVTDLVVSRKPNGEFQISDADSKKFGDVVQKLTSQIITTTIMDTEEYISNSKYYDDCFIDLKARTHPGRSGDATFEKLFVKTNSYALIEKQQVFFVVGRKGSGKSTITKALPLLNTERYLSHLEINADHYNLEALFALFSSSQYRSDSDSFFPRIKAFEMTWEAVALISALQYLSAKSSVPEELTILNDFLSTLTGDSPRQPDGISWGVSDLFSYCFARNIAFTQQCIDTSRTEPDFFWVDVESLYNLEDFLIFVLSREVLSLGRCLIRSFTGKFLVSLDGFDDAFDSFRVNTMRSGDRRIMAERAHFEIDWLRSILSFTLRAHRYNDNYLYSRLEFCIAAPLDRFLEVARINRDSYRAIGRWHSIQWSGIELSILLRKRLEYVISNDYESPRNLSPEERLAHVLNSRPLRMFPKEISFQYNDTTISIPLFIYVLRHTFWRPREVLIYYSRLLALVDSLKKWNKDITTESLRRCIKRTTETIIKNQFLNEFKTSLLNIEEVIHSFKKQPNILDYDKLVSIVHPVDFIFATDTCFAATIVEKLRYLYDVGFIGFFLSKNQQQRLGSSHKHSFIFNEGPLIFSHDNIDEADICEFKYLIHPIFCEYLMLNTDDSDFTLVFDWEYLHHAEADLRDRQMFA